MSRLQVKVLGSPQVEIDDEIVQLKTQKAVALLLYLAVTAETQRRDTLATLLWPQFSQKKANASLRNALSTLKKAIGSNWLHTDRYTIGLNWEANIEVDLIQFRQLLAAPIVKTPPNDDPTAQAMHFAGAIDLYRDDFLTGFSLRDAAPFDEWQFFETEGLRQEWVHTLERAIDLFIKAGVFAPAIPYARRWVTSDPLHEPAHYRLMQLYAQTGQRAAALRQYQECKRILSEELDLPPGEDLNNLYQRIHSQTVIHVSPFPEQTSPEDSLQAAIHLPVYHTPFIGRQSELEEIAAALTAPVRRLLTIVGPGGIGKTRLAVQAAAEQRDQFAQGLWYVDLAPLRSSHFLVSAIVDALPMSLHSQHEMKQQLLDYLQGRELLLLLDNFEQLLDGSAVINDILDRAPQVKILITSREPLDLTAEWLYPLQGLPVPEASPTAPIATYGSVQLFIQRARQVNPTFSLAQEATAVMQICRLLEGMPLGLELAAAWVRSLPSATIAQEIESNLDFLTSTRRDAQDRHRSLRAVFAHSWQLLSAAEQQALALLSLFRGGFTRAAALAVADTTLFTLHGLVNKSLLQLQENGRYTIHERLRQFAAEKRAVLVIDEMALHHRYAAYYTAFLQAREAALYGPKQQEMLEDIRQEIENIRQVWQWAVTNADVETTAGCLHGLYCYYSIRSLFQEGQGIFATAVTVLSSQLETISPSEQIVLAKLLARQGEFAYILGDLAQAEETLRQSLTLCQSQKAQTEMALCYQLLGNVTYVQGQYIESEELLRQGLHIAVTREDRHRQALILLSLGAVEQALGRYGEAQHTHQSCLAIYEQLNYQWGIGQALRFLGIAAYRLQQYDAAYAYLSQSLTICQMIQNQSGVALACNYLGMLAYAMGDYDRADQLYQQGLQASLESHLRMTISLSLQNLGHLLLIQGDKEQATTYLRRALQTAVSIQAPPLILDIMLEMVLELNAPTQVKQALTLTAFIQQHPASSWETKNKASQIQHRLTATISPQLVASVQAQARTQNLEEVISAIGLSEVHT